MVRCGKDWPHSQTVCLLPPNTRNHCFEDALHHLATLRALLRRLEPVGLTVPSMSRCLSLSPFLMFLSKMPRLPSWYDRVLTPKLPQRGWGGGVGGVAKDSPYLFFFWELVRVRWAKL